MSKIKLLINYIVYRLNRRGSAGHGIHSPFLFRFNRDVLNCREFYEEYNIIEEYRMRLTRSDQKIGVKDQGAGSRVFKGETRRVSDIMRISASNRKTGKLLFRIARYCESPVMIELGTSLGYGTMCLASGNPEGKVFSVEACKNQAEIAAGALRRTGIENFEILTGRFRDVLPGLLSGTEQPGLVYFDGDHRKDELLWQFEILKRRVLPSTIFVVGDIHWSPGMEQAWKEMCRDASVSLTVDLFWCGLIFFRKGMVRQHHILSVTD